MGQVLAPLPVNEKTYYKFDRNFWGTLILWVGRKVQNFDTNTGYNDGEPHYVWRKATLEEAELVLREAPLNVILSTNKRYKNDK